MSAKISKVKTDSELTPDELRARSVAKLSKYIEHNDLASEQGVGTWVKPQGFEDWHFVRFDKRVGFHLETARVMKLQGYEEAPPGTKLVGLENETEYSIMLCAPPSTYYTLREMKNKARLERANIVNGSLDAALGQISDMGGDVSLVKKEIVERMPK